MEPVKHYEVLASFELDGAIQEVGTIVELADSKAAPFITSGHIKEHGDNSAPEGGTGGLPPATPPVSPQDAPGGAVASPSVEPSSEPATSQEAPKTADPAPSESVLATQSGWVGNHYVKGNEPNPHKGGGLTDRHPDLSPVGRTA